MIGRERNNDAGKTNVGGDTFPAVTEMEREEAAAATMLPDIIVTDASADLRGEGAFPPRISVWVTLPNLLASAPPEL